MKNMGDGRRVARVETEVQRLVAQYLITHLREEVPGIVTVARVKMPADLRLAKVYISVLNFDGKMLDVIKTLQSHAAEIQRFIADHLRMRYSPKVAFFEDDVTQKVLKVDGILRSLAAESGASESSLRAVPNSEETELNDDPDKDSDE